MEQRHLLRIEYLNVAGQLESTPDTYTTHEAHVKEYELQAAGCQVLRRVRVVRACPRVRW